MPGFTRYLQCIGLAEDAYDLGPDFDDMSSFFPCEMDDEIQYINLGYGEQAPKIVTRIL